MKNTNNVFVPAASRVLDILEYAAKQSDGINLKDISESLEIPQASAFRLVKQLVARNYLEEIKEKSGYYRLGLQVLFLSSNISHVSNISKIAKPEMHRLAEETMQTVQLGVLRGNQVMYIEQVLPPASVNITTDPYSLLPINVSAAGKVLLAFMPKVDREAILSNIVFPKRTTRTISDVEEFKNSLVSVRENGYAKDDEEFAIGIGCLASPIFDCNSKCIAAIGITGSIHNYLSNANQSNLIDLVKKASQNISNKLGYKGTF